MASYDDLETYLKYNTNLEGTQAVALMNPAINFGLWLATAVYEPPVQKTSTNITAVTTGDNISLSGMTRLMRLDHLYNTTQSKQMWPMSYEQLRMAYIPDSEAVYYALHGNTLFYRATPASNETIKAYFLQYPGRINSGDSLPFDEFQDFVLSAATQFLWASQEEPENVDMWGKLTQMVGAANSALILTKQVMQREGIDVNNLSRIVPKGSSPS